MSASEPVSARVDEEDVATEVPLEWRLRVVDSGDLLMESDA